MSVFVFVYASAGHSSGRARGGVIVAATLVVGALVMYDILTQYILVRWPYLYPACTRHVRNQPQ
jgi:hypothetical protein